MTFRIKQDTSFTDLLKHNLAAKYRPKRRNSQSAIHVSDILPSSCLRRQYYRRKSAGEEEEEITDESVHHFVRGEASEHVITKLANIGVAQAEVEMGGLIAHPDILAKGKVVVELKDTANGKRLDIADDQFRAYLRLLLYYLVMTETTSGILCIRYNTKELNWYKRDSEQNDHYLRPHNAKNVGIESWQISLSMDDPLRGKLKEEMIKRKELFQTALRNDDVSMLPRLTGHAKILKCRTCPSNTQCRNQDHETLDAIKLRAEEDLVDTFMTQIKEVA